MTGSALVSTECGNEWQSPGVVQSWEIVCLIFAAVVVILLFSLQRKLDHKARSASLSPCLFPLSVSFSH
jgi:hypothetical protein